MTETPPEPQRLNRRELYEQVWQTSAVKLAKIYGISDVMIHKICEKHQIPKPPPGYWAQVQHGAEMVRPPLPPIDDPALDVIVIAPQPRSSRDRPVASKDVITVPVAEPRHHNRWSSERGSRTKRGSGRIGRGRPVPRPSTSTWPSATGTCPAHCASGTRC
jgi:hypothetical protein